MVATWLAIDHPSRVDHLILASTLSWGFGARNPGRAWSVGRCLAKRAGERDACLVRRILTAQFVAEHPLEVDRILAIARQHPTSLSSILTLLAAAARHDARTRLSRIAAPTLVLAGTRDQVASPRSQRRLADSIRGARYEGIDAGHDLTLEAPLETAERVLAHIERQ
jgi:3-oxoadipate enol-lactonase